MGDSAAKQVLDAAKSGDVGALRALLAAKAPTDHTNEIKRTPLHYASEKGHLECVIALLGAGADKEAKDRVAWTPLHFAAKSGGPKCIMALLEAGADKEAKDKSDMTPLHWSACNNLLECVTALLGAGADKEAKDNNGLTPLHYAAKNEHPGCRTALLGAGADKEAKDKDGQTPLYVAAAMGNLKCVTALLGVGADKEAKDNVRSSQLHFLDGRTPLIVAAAEGMVDCVLALLDAQADKNAKDTATIVSVKHAHPLGLFSERPLFPKMRDYDRGSCDVCDKDQMSWRCAEGCYFDVCNGCGLTDENTQRMGGNTPLLSAATGGHLECITALLAAGMDKEEKNLAGDTALASAGRHGKVEAVEALLAMGAEYESVLHLIVQRDENARVVFDLASRDRRLPYRATDGKGRPAIHLAHGQCKEALLKALFLLGRFELIKEEAPKHRSATCVVLFGQDHRPPGSGSAQSKTRDCVLKLMRNRDQWERELNARGGALEGVFDTSSAAGSSPQPQSASVLAENEEGKTPAATWKVVGGGGAAGGAAKQGEAFSPKHVMPVLTAHALSEEEAKTLGADLRDFRFLLVLPQGEEDLAGAIAHARMTADQARVVARSVALDMKHLHEKGYAHCDLKPLNVVRVKAPEPSQAKPGAADDWLLIDLDACSRIGEGFVGLKSSTAFIPPELLYFTASEAASQPLPPTGDATKDAAPTRTDETVAAPAVASVLGGAGWRVRAVDESGAPLDGTQRFTALKAHASFDMWSFGCVLFELLVRSGLWHADTDSNLHNPEDYRRLAEWSAADARAAVSRVPDRWAQALLLRLLAPSLLARPPSFDAVLEHPFFTMDESFAAPPLTGEDKTHVFISHFQGNAGPRCMTLKFAILQHCPGALVWLDQDQRDKTEEGMMDGVRTSSVFLLFLTEGLFARWFCKKEILMALESKKPIVLVREMDTRQGAPRAFGKAPPTVRCSGGGGEGGKCMGTATHGHAGGAWPTRCAAHAEAGMAECSIDRSLVSDTALSCSLIFDESGRMAFVDPEALQIATTVLGPPNGEPHSSVRGSVVRWFSELEFRTVSLAKLLTALGMRVPLGAEGAADPPPVPAPPSPPRAEAEVLQDTLRVLAMRVPAPPLPEGCAYHVCIVHDTSCVSAHSVCTALRDALLAAFGGAKVFLTREDPAELAAAAASSACVVPFVTLGLLRAGGPAAAAVAAGISAKRRFVVPYEFEVERGGTPSVQTLIEETASEAKGLWAATAFPWLGADADTTAVCALRLVIDGIMDQAGAGQRADPTAQATADGAGAASAAASAATATPQQQPQEQGVAAASGVGATTVPLPQLAATTVTPESGAALPLPPQEVVDAAQARGGAGTPLTSGGGPGPSTVAGELRKAQEEVAALREALAASNAERDRNAAATEVLRAAWGLLHGH